MQLKKKLGKQLPSEMLYMLPDGPRNEQGLTPRQVFINARAAVIHKMIDNLDQPTMPIPFPDLVITNGPTKEPQQEAIMYQRELEQINHLERRLDRALNAQEEKLRLQFFIDWEDFPKTPAEFKARLTTGKYTLDFYGKKDDDELESSNAWISDYFSWRTTKADHKGYEAARKLLKADYVAARDQFFLGYPEGLKALQDFEAKTYN